MARQRAFDILQNVVENIIEKPLEKVLPDSMMPYSEYVILDRALPRVEDGLKPVQRRILYSMRELNIKPDGPYKKSARVVGECLGKFHPHGDTSVYDAMVRMAQNFNMRVPLVDGHGNFGSIDGDPAAAMRYTEVRMDQMATELLRDIDKNTVKWNKNFDDSLDEPDVLPGRFPNLLVNGAQGIAIGLATNIPSHNLAEVINGCIAMIDKPTIKVPELMQYIKGPDFPTGGFLVSQGLREIYETGRGKFVLRAKVDIENTDGDRQNIVISEIPYNANKNRIMEQIFKMREKAKNICGNIISVDDESDRSGMRMVVKLKKGEDAVKILNYLIAHTDLQVNFNANMVAIAGGKPRQMGLIDILKYYLEFQRSVIYKRSQYDLNVAKKREHILEGFHLIIPAIDEVIAIIRAASSRTEAKTKLRVRFELSEQQAEAILSLQLGNINKLDVGKFEKELKELRSNISKLTAIIGSTREQYRVVREELLEIRDKYKSRRLTTIIGSLDDVEIKAFDPTKRTAKRGMLSLDVEGRVKFLTSRNYVSANRAAEEGGEEGLSVSLTQCEPENLTLIFGNFGNCYRLDTDTVPERKWMEKGIPLSEIYPDAGKEKAVFALSFSPESVDQQDFYLFTKFGMVKKTPLKQYIVNKNAYQVCNLKEGDEIIGGEVVKENSTIMFITSDGLCVHTFADDYPTQGRVAGGVIGANLNQGATVIYAGQTEVEAEFEGETVVYRPMGELLVITDKGVGKRVIAREFEPMMRNRKGVRIQELSERGKLIFACGLLDEIVLGVVTDEHEVHALNTEEIRIDSRTSKGKPVVRGCVIKKIVRHYEEME